MNDRDEFITRYLPVVEATVHGFIMNYPSKFVFQFREDMFGEASLALVKIADKFFADDSHQKSYVRNYVQRATVTKCVDVLRKIFQEKERISVIAEKFPFNGSGLLVLDTRGKYTPHHTLLEKIRAKYPINWAEHLSPQDAATVAEFLAMYATDESGSTQEKRRTQNRLRPKVKRIIKPLLK